MFVDILINLPVGKLNQQEFTYRVPEDLEPDMALGKRVLVELGRRRVEGFITATGVKEIADARPILKVLDEEPVFDRKLLDLARWVAEYYLCPLSLVLNAMIPPRLGKSGSKRILALISREEAEEQSLLWNEVGSNRILKALWKSGELDYRQVLKEYSGPELKELEERGLVLVTGVYSGYRSVPKTCIYRVKAFDPSTQMEGLKKKAPAQARFMEALLGAGPLDSSQARRLASRSSIDALLKKGYIEKSDRPESEPRMVTGPELNPEQEKAAQIICAAIRKGCFSEYLLYGVTGSGKTEVYIRAAREAIRGGKQALVLVPEIALSRHLINVFSSRIPHTAVLHSRMPQGARLESWKKIRQGEVDLVLGTRSAVFAPLSRLGLVVIDEEQENSFKQEEQPRYHAREVAAYRAAQENAVLVMGSATPSLETFYRATRAPDHLLTLPHRIGRSRLPMVRVVDMRRNSPPGSGILSPLLQQKLQVTMDKGEQAILVLNRRGFTTMSVCRKCGAVARCPHCSVALTYHRASGKAICHYCDYRTEPLSACPDCGSPALQQLGAGTQKLEEEVRRMFPAARLERMDLDNSRRQGFQAQVIQTMEEGNIDILIGTQMVARGLHFPRVSLVGILNVDQMLNLPDFRAGERTFQFIVQAAGRAGRGELPGEVILQTFNPGSTVIEMASHLNFPGFYQEELELRRLLQYPPFTHVLRIVVSSPREDLARKAANMIRLEINDIIDAREEEITILGPAPCPLARLRDRFRYQLMVKCDGLLLLNSIGHFLQFGPAHYDARMELDINPVTTM